MDSSSQSHNASSAAQRSSVAVAELVAGDDVALEVHGALWRSNSYLLKQCSWARRDLVAERAVKTGCQGRDNQKRLVAACESMTPRGIHPGSQAQRSRYSAGSHHGLVQERAGTQKEGSRREVAACHGGCMDSHHATPRCWMTRQTARDENLRGVVWNDVCATNGAVVALPLVRLFFETSVAGLVAAVVSETRCVWKKCVAIAMLNRTVRYRLLPARLLLRKGRRRHSSSRSQSSQSNFVHLRYRLSDSIYHHRMRCATS